MLDILAARHRRILLQWMIFTSTVSLFRCIEPYQQLSLTAHLALGITDENDLMELKGTKKKKGKKIDDPDFMVSWR